MQQNTTSILVSLLFILSSDIAAQSSPEKEILWTAAWSPNGKYIAIGGNVGALNIYTAKRLQGYQSYPIENTITCVKWHPHKNILAVATQMSSNKVRVINFDTNSSIELDGVSPDGARGIDWNYSGEFLAVADNDGQICIFDLEGKLIRKINPEHTKSFTAIDWHPKQNIFAVVGDNIRLYDIQGNLLKTIVHRPEATLLLSVAWHKSGDFFVTGDYGDTQLDYKPLLQFWTANGDLLKSISKSKAEYRNLSWNAKGDRLATASDALRIWDKAGNLLQEGASKDYLWGLSWNKNGTRIVTSSIAQVVTIWDEQARKLFSDE